MDDDPPTPAAAAGVQAGQRRHPFSIAHTPVVTSHKELVSSQVATAVLAALFAPSYPCAASVASEDLVQNKTSHGGLLYKLGWWEMSTSPVRWTHQRALTYMMTRHPLERSSKWSKQNPTSAILFQIEPRVHFMCTRAEKHVHLL